jgi:tRNA modification GTPase
VLYGAPNVGKSSLINALAGFERAIVFDQPGTTRDVVTVETAFDGWPVRLSDTAGIRISHDQIEAAGIARAKNELATADLRICVCDSSDATSFEVLQAAEILPSLVVANKCDLPGCSFKTWEGEAPAEPQLRRAAESTLAAQRELRPPVLKPPFKTASGVEASELPREAIRVSARTKAGLSELMSTISRRLVPRVPSADEAVPISERQIVSLTSARAALAGDHVDQYRQSIRELVSSRSGVPGSG